VRDGISLAKAGHPVVVFLQTQFENAARAQAKGLGMPELRCFAYPQHRPGDVSSPREEEQAVKATAELPRLLLAPSTC